MDRRDAGAVCGAKARRGAWGGQGWRRHAALVLALSCAVRAAAAAGPQGGDVDAGRAEFARCAWCHQAGPSARSGFGPQLTGIVGRRAGAATDYKYSVAMKNSGVVWNEATLAAFVKAPQKVVPDNKMRFWGISDERRIANLLAYLRTL